MSDRSFLLETPPYCPTPECSVHYVYGRAFEVEHHVAGCPMRLTVSGQVHAFDHTVKDAMRRVAAASLEAFTSVPR